MVYVQNIHGKPLMPCKEAKARKLLKYNRAVVIQRTPFVIQLTFECENQTQPITLGVDAGRKHIGLSATTEKEELYAAEVELRNDIVDLLSTRRQNRKARRSRLRHRPARFNNRVRSKNKGWLAPSIEQKIQTHLKVVEDVHKLLPITKIIVETASFDIHKIKNPGYLREGVPGRRTTWLLERPGIRFMAGRPCLPELQRQIRGQDSQCTSHREPQNRWGRSE